MPTIRVRPRVLKRRLALTGLGAIAAAGMLVMPPSAHAGPNEDRAFIQTLDHFAVPYSTVPKVIDAGHAVCDGIDGGLTPIGVMSIAMRAGFGQTDAAHLVGAAIGAYCNEYAYLLDPAQAYVA